MIPYLYELSFYALAGIIIFSALLVIHLKKIIHSAMFLGVFLITIGELYLMLNAEFLGVIQILVYAGGVTVVMLFALMLAPQKDEGDLSIAPFRNLAASLLILSLIAVYLMGLSSTSASIPEPTSDALSQFASLLFSEYYATLGILTLTLVSVMMISEYLSERRKKS